MKAQLLSVDLLVAGALLLGAYTLLSQVTEHSFLVGGVEYPQGTSCYYEYCSDFSQSTNCVEPLECANVFVSERVLFDGSDVCLRSERVCGG